MYITDKNGEVIQHTEYMAFGETFVDEHSVSPTQPYLFNGKELDYETGLYYYGARYYDPKTSIFLNVDPLVKEERYFDDEDLVSNGGGIYNPQNYGVYSYTYNNPVMFTDPDGKCPTCPDEVYVAIADHVYTDNLRAGMKTDNNWEAIRVDKTESGYVGALYKGTHNGKTDYIYASKGTTMTSLQDWSNNIYQADLGLSPQCYDAITFAEKYIDTYKGISFTGHSKGGGQATAQAMKVGGKAVVFNPASVSDKTIKNYNLNPNSANIKSIIVQGEILNSLQEIIGMNKHGNIIDIKPYKKQSGRVERHGMDFVKKSHEAFQGKRPYDNRTFRQ